MSWVLMGKFFRQLCAANNNNSLMQIVVDNASSTMRDDIVVSNGPQVSQPGQTTNQSGPMSNLAGYKPTLINVGAGVGGCGLGYTLTGVVSSDDNGAGGNKRQTRMMRKK